MEVKSLYVIESSIGHILKKTNEDGSVQFAKAVQLRLGESPDSWEEITMSQYAIDAPEEQDRRDLEEIKKEYIQFIQDWMDSEAKKLGYDDIKSAVGYENSDIPKFRSEGIAFRKWRDQVWSVGYTLLDKVMAGEMERPTSSELIGLLPKINIEYTEE